MEYIFPFYRNEGGFLRTPSFLEFSLAIYWNTALFGSLLLLNLIPRYRNKVQFLYHFKFLHTVLWKVYTTPISLVQCIATGSQFFLTD